ncbi:unnamed protein product, partial [Phaeothamnion confervicola]
LLHYTRPGDVVLAGFCGTGMTGVAALLCGDRAEVQSLGYRVDEDGQIFSKETDGEETKWMPFSKLGARRTILNDLSPAATFISSCYNAPLNLEEIEAESSEILAAAQAECDWMYETKHSDGRRKGKINYTVWSDVFSCPECAGEVVFWNVAVDQDGGQVRDDFTCPHCSADLSKRNMERAWTTKYDSAINKSVTQAKQVPVLINYSVDGKRFEKSPDALDL